MSGKTNIAWAHRVWNPVVGCTRVSAGCLHCYAETLHDRRHKAFLAGKSVAPQYAEPFRVVQLLPQRLRDPLHWRAPARVFVNSVSDLFHGDVPDEFIADVFMTMWLAHYNGPGHRFLILTKRAQRMRDVMNRLPAIMDARRRAATEEKWGPSSTRHYPEIPWPLPNVWLGVSVENQKAADERIPLLQHTPAAVRWLSCEPLLGPISFRPKAEGATDGDLLGDMLTLMQTGEAQRLALLDKIHWIVTGGESGPGRRPFDPAWASGIRRQCERAGVAFFHKQNGGLTPTSGGRLLDGQEWNAYPEAARA